MGVFDALLGISQGALATSNQVRIDQEKEKKDADDLAKTQMDLGLKMGDQGAFDAGATTLGVKGLASAPFFQKQAASQAMAARGEQLDQDVKTHTMKNQDASLSLDVKKQADQVHQWMAANGFESQKIANDLYLGKGRLANEATQNSNQANYQQGELTLGHARLGVEKQHYDNTDSNGEDRRFERAFQRATAYATAHNGKLSDSAGETEQEAYRVRFASDIDAAMKSLGIENFGLGSMPNRPFAGATGTANRNGNAPVSGGGLDDPPWRPGQTPTPGPSFGAALGHTPAPVARPSMPPMHQGYVPRPQATPAIPTPSGTGRWSHEVDDHARRNNVDPALVVAIMQQESGGNPDALSPVGAQGLMQLMPGTASGLGVDATNPQQNIAGATKHIAQLLKQFKGDIRLTAAAYNAGSDDTEASKGKRIGPFAKSHDNPKYRVWENPDNGGYAETRDYVDKVLANYARLTGGEAPPAQQQPARRPAAPVTRANSGGGSTPAANAVLNKFRPSPLPSDHPAN